jgi:hypothetical protein
VITFFFGSEISWLMLMCVFCFCRILHGNNLVGTIPKELCVLESLKVLDLGMNRLTGLTTLLQIFIRCECQFYNIMVTVSLNFTVYL